MSKMAAPKHTQGLQLETQPQPPDLPVLGSERALSSRSSQAASKSPDRDIFSFQSDMDRALCDITLSQGSMEDESASFPSAQAAAPSTTTYSGDPILLARFSTLLEQELENASKRITSDLKHEFQELGSRIGTIEATLDDTITRTNQNMECIEDIHKRLDDAPNKIDNLENRSRRYNFRVQGIPESFPDSEAIMKELIQHLIPDIPHHKLELDRAHRALTTPRDDGLPRDVIVKPHYYVVKEQVMARAREIAHLQLRDHKIQIFADISPTTIQKRRALKPLLQPLITKNIKYYWAFPFRLNFTYRNNKHFFSTFLEGDALLKKLGLISVDPERSSCTPQSGSSNVSTARSHTSQV